MGPRDLPPINAPASTSPSLLLLPPHPFGSTNSSGDRWRLALCCCWGFLKFLVVGVSNALISSEALHPVPSQAISWCRFLPVWPYQKFEVHQKEEPTTWIDSTTFECVGDVTCEKLRYGLLMEFPNPEL
ncbi:unnamed protein product, partial [Musa textilis]